MSGFIYIHTTLVASYAAEVIPARILTYINNDINQIIPS
jgi:hypothetical protein